MSDVTRKWLTPIKSQTEPAIHPALETHTEFAIVLVVAANEFLRNLALAHIHPHDRNPVHQQIQQGGFARRIGDADIQDGMQALPHRIQHEGHPTRFGFEQMLIR